MGIHLLGKQVAEPMNAQTAVAVAELVERGITPCMAILQVGEREDSSAYGNSARKRAAGLGIAVRNVRLPEQVSQAELLLAVQDLNNDASVHGVLILMPLPAHINQDLVRNSLAVEKDIDGISNESIVAIFKCEDTGFAPCTPEACISILDAQGYDFKGKRALVVGRSMVVGRPLAMMLLRRDATVSIAHSHTKDLAALCRESELIISCVGQSEFLQKDCFVAGQYVVDVGINVAADGSLKGDVDFAAAEPIVAAITPVPGGVGAVTTSVLARHTVLAAGLAGRRTN